MSHHLSLCRMLRTFSPLPPLHLGYFQVKMWTMTQTKLGWWGRVWRQPKMKTPFALRERLRAKVNCYAIFGGKPMCRIWALLTVYKSPLHFHRLCRIFVNNDPQCGFHIDWCGFEKKKKLIENFLADAPKPERHLAGRHPLLLQGGLCLYQRSQPPIFWADICTKSE